MDTVMTQRQRLLRVLTIWVLGFIAAAAWFPLWEFVLTPFDRGTFLYRVGGGLGLIAVYCAVIRAVPAFWKQVNQEMTTRGMVILTAMSILTVVGVSLLYI
jgi:hypothetical protein